MDAGLSSIPDLNSPLFGSTSRQDTPVETKPTDSNSIGNGHADSMSDSSDSSSHSNSDSEVEESRKKNSSSEEETELPKQVRSSDDDEEDYEDDDNEQSKHIASDNENPVVDKKVTSDGNSSDENDLDSSGKSLEASKESIQRSLFESDSQDTGDNEFSREINGRKVSSIRELKDDWDQAPDLYGIRRSGRSRREVVRYNVGNSGSESDKKKKKRNRRKGSEEWDDNGDDDDDETDESSGSDNFKPSRAIKRAKPQSRSTKRRTGRSTQNKSKSRRKNYSSSGSSDESGEFNRPVPQRKSAQKVSYKEDTDEATDSDDIIEAATPAPEVEEENKETIEKVLDVRFGKKGATGHKTTLYNVRENGDPNLSPLKENEKDEKETQYLIKWKNWAHIHNTWETDHTLRDQKVNGLKRFEKAVKLEEEINEWKRLATPEDIEYHACQQEMLQELTESHKHVERIISHRKDANGVTEYLCKWQGLPYTECTWEDGELASKLFQSQIDKYLARNKSQCIPTKLSRVLKNRPKFLQLKSQPTHLGGSEDFKLRDYQLDGLNWMLHAWCKGNSVILADEMGLGKTIQIISFVSHLHNQYQLYGPFLLVVPLSTIVAWQREFEKWAPEMNIIVYMGDVNSRTIIREQEWRHPGNKRLKFNVLLTTYEILLKDKTFLGAESWAFLGVDEAHRLKNDDSLLYRSLENFETNHKILITGTPLQNSLKELWSLLHFIMPDRFDSWVDFEERHSKEEGKGFTSLHKQLEPYLLRRDKKDVEKSLPAKSERILRVQLSSLQKTYYKAILQREFRTLMKGMRGNVSSFNNILMELKKCANHSYLVAQPEDEAVGRERLTLLLKGSGKLLLLDKLLVRLKETGHRVLIFSQMVRMLDIIADYLSCRHFPFQRLDGSIRGDLRKQALDHFNADGSQDFCFLLSTRAGGLGINLATADTVIIFDSDWNPQNDLQAQARAHRIGQTKQVSVYRLVTNATVEEKIVESAKKKMVLDHLVIQRMDTTGRTVLDKSSSSASSTTPFSKDELCAILKFGAEELFKGTENEDEDEQQVDIDDILSRAEEHETQENTVGNDLLSQFKVASFGNLEEEAETRTSFGDEEEKDWDEIIPEDVRVKMEEEERQQQLLVLELGPRNRRAVQQLQVDYDSDKEKKSKKKQSESEGSEDDDDDDEPRKRGRPKGNSKDGVRGFSNAEIRRFVKSYKKFAAPLKRLDAIAEDAELPEKSEADLRRLAEFIRKSCDEAVKEHALKAQECQATEPGAKKSLKGPSFKIASVSINAQALLKAEEDMKPLADNIPEDKEERKKWRIEQTVKKVHWDCFWNLDDDSSLLKGVYEFGYGSWEAIKMEQDLGLSDRILPDGELKPQVKHLQTRVDYLLKAMKKDSVPSPAKQVKPRKRNPKSKAEVVDTSSDDEKDKKASTESAISKKKTEKEVKKENDLSDISDVELESDEEKKPKPKPKGKKVKKEVKEEKKEKKVEKGKKNKKKSGPMHFTASSEPKEIGGNEGDDVLKKMDDKTFSQCKETMRPMKKVLRQLNEPDETLDEKEQVSYLRGILLKIGDHINSCIGKHTDPEKIKLWRNNLWLFVSNFTTLTDIKLRKLYKAAKKKREGEQEKQEVKSKKRPLDKSESSKDGSSKKAQKSEHHQKHQHKESTVNSNHKTQRSGSHHPAFRSKDTETAGSISPNSNWKLASPLSRTEDTSTRNRFDNSYNRHVNPHHQSNAYSSHHDSHRNDRKANDSSKEYYRFNDRQGPAGQHYHRDFRNRNEHRGGFRPDPHRGDHYRPEYGNHYRDQANAATFNRERNSTATPEEWSSNSFSFSSGGDRKRRDRGEEYHDWDRRSHKDPRIDKSRYASHGQTASGDSSSFSHH